MMDDAQEIKQILREIRDLQKAHFERYKEFTQALLDRNQTDRAAADRARKDQQLFREEMRQVLKDNRARMTSLIGSRWTFLGISAVAIALALGSLFVSIFLRLLVL
jgi:hypothetical protein